jgi:hypothetical protein
MERGSWTDARLDDRFDQIDRRFDQLDRRFDRFEEQIGREFIELRSTIVRFNSAMIVGLLGVIAAILARGA